MKLFSVRIVARTISQKLFKLLIFPILLINYFTPCIIFYNSSHEINVERSILKRKKLIQKLASIVKY